MSSFSENSVAVAQEPMQLGYGTHGGDDNGETASHAPPVVLPPNLSETAPATTVYEPEGVLLTNLESGEKIDDGSDGVYEPVPMVYQPEPEAVVSAAEVVPEVMDATAVVDVDTRVVANDNNPSPHDQNNEVVVDYQVLPPCQTNPHDQNNDNYTNHVFNDDNINVVVTPVVSNLNSNEVVTPSVVSNQNNNVVVDYQDNGIVNNTTVAVGEAIRRKRGRPRKNPISDASSNVPVSSGPVLVTAQVQGSSEKRGRGRPAGSGKKHKAHAPSPFTVSPAISGSSTGSGFMPYIITVRSGEYVQPKLLSLSQVDEQVVCVLSASGNISNVTLQQPSQSGGTVTYQGCFEILSLSGSYLLSESGGRRSITGGLSVSLAAPKGHIFGGGVAGPLIAGSDVQIIVGTFLASEQQLTIPHCNEVLTAPPNHISPVGESPPSRALLSESSGAGESHLIYSNGGLNNGNLQPVPKVAWM